MVFVTVGTHEQPFDRLMREIDRLVALGELSDVIVQYGYSSVRPHGCRCEQFLPYDEMVRLYDKADVVVCHGGPSTFMEAISHGKVPVVVPRQASFGEHVNNHQCAFCHLFAERVGGIEVVEDIKDLGSAIMRVQDTGAMNLSSNNSRFCKELADRVAGIVKKDA